MKQSKFLSAALFAAAAVIATPAVNGAVTVRVLAVGSSAEWQNAGYSTWFQLAGAGAQHYTVKGSCPSLGNCSQMHDSRLATILNETGSLWVVWNSAETEAWAYLNVDTIVGNRAYFAVPRTTLQIDPETETANGVPAAQTNLISSVLWGVDAANIPTAVYTALNNATFTMAFSDVRPEDAKFESCRVLNQLNTTTYAGLGYGTGTTCTAQQGTSILSSFTTNASNPVNYNIKGTDPITGQAVKPYSTLEVGADAIVFVVNRTNPNGLGYGGAGTPSITNVTVAEAQKLFSGTQCDTAEFAGAPPTDTPVYPVLREPLSGTMTTTEFTTFRCGTSGAGNYTGAQCAITGTAAKTNSQEKNINPALPNNNPLNLTCLAGGGSRYRGIGTGEVIGNGVLKVADSIGYTFYSYGNVSKLAGSTSYGYLTLNGVDPIYSTYTNGELPVCTGTGGSGICPTTPGTSFPNLRSGKYPAWSVLRAITAQSGPALTNAILLVNAIQNNVNTTVPDFVPFAATGGDPGLQLYRSHYPQSSVSANNGLSGEKESGGDAGGCIEPVTTAPGVTGCHQ